MSHAKSTSIIDVEVTSTPLPIMIGYILHFHCKLIYLQSTQNQNGKYSLWLLHCGVDFLLRSWPVANTVSCILLQITSHCTLVVG